VAFAKEETIMTGTNALPEGYKALDLGELPEGWAIKPLLEIISFRKGRKPNNLSETPATDKVPYLTADYFRTGIASQYVNLSKDPSAISVATEDVVFIWDGSNAGDVFLGLKGVLASTMTVIRGDPNIVINDWIYYVLKTNFQTFNTQTTGSTIPHVNKNLFLNLPVTLPPLPEQHPIAHVLRTVQEAKEKTDAVIAATKALKASMMKHLFTYGPVSLEDAGDVALKETEIGPVPKGWKVKKVGDYCLSSAFGPRFSNRLYDDNGNIALLRTTDLDVDGTISYSTMPRANLEIAQFKNHFLLPNDLVISRSGTCGIAAVFSNYEIPVLPGAFLIRFRLSNEIDPIFLKYYINSEAGQSRISQLAEGAIQKNLSGKKILNFYIPVPSRHIQREVLTLILTIDQKLAAEQSHRQALDTLFATLLHDLMTAKIRVQLS
jgi:type I restriction enzyme S subunit